MADQQFIYKPREIILDKRLSPVEQDYLCLIAALEKADGCTASNNWFGRFFGVRRQTAQESISKLKVKNFIVCRERKEGRKTVERIIEIVDTDSRKNLLMDSRESLPKSPKLKRQLGRTTLPGIAGSSVGVSRQNPTHIIKNIAKGARNIQKPLSDNGGFDKFWEAYPKHQRKLDAQKAWRKLNPGPELAERIIADVERRSQLSDWQKENGKYVPMPTSYLNGERWTDELAEPRRGDPNWLPTEAETEQILKECSVL
jgi:hypothetical protein